MIEKLNLHYSFTNPASIHDEEALTALELAGRQGAKINEVVTDQNALRDEFKNQTENVIPATIKEDVQKHIDSGDFDKQIDANNAEFIAKVENDLSRMDSRLNNLLGSVPAGSTTMDAEVIDMRVDVAGRTHTSAGEAIRHQFDMLPVAMPSILSAGDLNNYTDAGNYVIGTSDPFTNVPDGFYDRGLQLRYLVVETFGEFETQPGWGRQTIYSIDGTDAYQRYFSHMTGSEVVWNNWNRIFTSIINHTVISNEECDINQIVEHGEYTIGVSSHINAPASFAGSGFKLSVLAFGRDWLVQIAYALWWNNESYIRIGWRREGYNFSENLDVEWQPWEKELKSSDLETALNNVNSRIDSISDNQSNYGYTIVNMGDSIFGNYYDDTSISHQLSLLTGATVYNCAFGGCQLTDRSDDPWRNFSMCNLADAIATGDFSAQTNAATHADVPAYFVDHVNALKNIDFSTVDVMTIAYGTNDFTFDDEIHDGEDTTGDKNRFKSALRYSLNTIGAAFPNIRFLICTPMWRCWFSNGVFQYDSDTYKPYTYYLIEYVNALKEVANEYHLPVCDYYNEMGLNKYNWPVFFTNTDGTHPHASGRALMAKKLAAKIREL